MLLGLRGWGGSRREGRVRRDPQGSTAKKVNVIKTWSRDHRNELMEARRQSSRSTKRRKAVSKEDADTQKEN